MCTCIQILGYKVCEFKFWDPQRAWRCHTLVDDLGHFEQVARSPMWRALLITVRWLGQIDRLDAPGLGAIYVDAVLCS